MHLLRTGWQLRVDLRATHPNHKIEFFSPNNASEEISSQFSQRTIYFKVASMKVKITGSEWVHKAGKTRVGGGGRQLDQLRHLEQRSR